MISGRLYPYLIYLIKVASALGFIPYQWDDKTSRLGHSSSKQAFLWYFWNILTWLHNTFLIVLFFTLFLFPEKLADASNQNKLLAYFYCSYMILGYLFVLVVFVQTNELLLINGMIDFETYAKDSVLDRNEIFLKEKGSGFVFIFMCSLIPTAIFIPTSYWLFPTGPQYIGSWIFNHSKHDFKGQWITLILSYLIETFFIVVMIGLVSLGAILSVLAPRCLNTYLVFIRELQLIPMNPWKRLQLQLSLYRQVQLLSNWYNSSFRQYYMPYLEFGASCVCILCLFGIIEREKYMIIGYFFGPLVLIPVQFVLAGVLESASRTLQNSRSVIMSMKRSRGIFNRKRISIIANSCNQINIYSGAFHIIKKERYAILLRFMLQRTFFIVVYLNQKK